MGMGGLGEEDNREGGQRKSRPLVFMYSRSGRGQRGKFQVKIKFTRSLPYIRQMIPSFTSFPSQPQQPDSEVPAPPSKRKSSKKDTKHSRGRIRDADEQGKRRHKHKDKQHDHDRDFKEDDRRQATFSSTTFFSDCRGNRGAVHGGGTDSIRVPKYNLVARTFLQNLARYS